VDVRHAAAQGLLMLRDRATLPRLKKLADGYPEVATRRILLQACQSAASVEAAGRTHASLR